MEQPPSMEQHFRERFSCKSFQKIEVDDIPEDILEKMDGYAVQLVDPDVYTPRNFFSVFA